MDELLLSLNSDEMQKFSPAFVWTESKEEVHLQVKLAYRWSSPGALSVEQHNVTIEKDGLHFSGVGVHSSVKKLYVLDLMLIQEVLPEESHWSRGAVGKFTFVLKKKVPAFWFMLTAQKIANMRPWYEMQDALERAEISSRNKDANATTTTNSTSEIQNSTAELSDTDQLIKKQLTHNESNVKQEL